MTDGVWRTVSGRRIFIKEGQSLTDAMKESGKFEKSKNIDNAIKETLKKLNEKELQEMFQNTKNEDVKKELQQEMIRRNNENNSTKILYHQTKADSLEGFSEDKRKAGLSDTSTPKGIFLKETDEDIGLEGKNQLKMEVKMEKPLTVKDRAELRRIVTNENKEYEKIINGGWSSEEFYENKNNSIESNIDTVYEKKYYAKALEEKEKYQSQLDKLYKEQDRIMSERENANANIGKIAQEEMTNTLKKMGYDSVILNEDEGSFGRKVKSYIVFDIKQLKQVK